MTSSHASIFESILEECSAKEIEVEEGTPLAVD